MSELSDQIRDIVQQCSNLPGREQQAFARKQCTALLAEFALNPTGDDPDPLIDLPGDNLHASVTQELRIVFEDFSNHLRLLRAAGLPLPAEQHTRLAGAIRTLVKTGHINSALAEKFRIPDNRQFLDRALINTGSAWQMAMVANWVLDARGIDTLAKGEWCSLGLASDLTELIALLSVFLRFDHLDCLRDYRRQAMRHVPRLTDYEFQALQSENWQEVIESPSDRDPARDIPLVTPFVKQGDIEYSLYRHYMMPDLSETMRKAIPATSDSFELTGADIDILFSLPLVIQQVEEELFNHVKAAIAGIIMQWSAHCSDRRDNPGMALRITERLWNYRRAPAASDCSNPVENLIKGFTATIRNSFSHYTDINIAASRGDRIDPFDVAEKFILFASVSNGQLDNLAEAHRYYCLAQPNPAHWDNEQFFHHFLAANKRNDLCHIQAHFLVDKTRGCPAIPQIPRFHGIVLDLVLEFVLREFGEANLRQAGAWYLREKTPGIPG